MKMHHGHKTATQRFFGYKTHLAMTEERIITALTVTSREKADGGQFIHLVEQSGKTGMLIDEIIGDKAYMNNSNFTYAQSKGIRMIARAHQNVSDGMSHGKQGFEFNKDADAMQCPAGELSMNALVKTIRGRKYVKYYFSIKKCKNCPQMNGCYNAGARECTYTQRLNTPEVAAQIAFSNSDYFKNAS